MNKKRIIILGAGLAGLSAAWHLQRRGVDCIVFEKEREAGGLCRSRRIGGFTFDYNGHLLHFKRRHIFRLVKKLLGSNLIRHHRKSGVYFDKHYIPYPFQANLYKLPEKVRRECLLGLIEAFSKNSLAGKKQKQNFLDWINCTFGKGIARHFLVPYNTKFWRISLRLMTCEWLDGFFPAPSLSRMIKGAVREDESRFGYNAEFWYPKNGGIINLANALSSGIKNIHTDCEVKKIDLKKKNITLSSGDKEEYDYLISTIPLPELPRLLDYIPRPILIHFRKLKWNSIFSLNLGLENDFSQKKHWVYFPQEDISFFRVGYYNNFSPYMAPRGRGALYADFSYSQDEAINKNKIIKRIKDGLKKAGILKGNKLHAEYANDIGYGYPIYDHNYCFARKEILNFLSKKMVIPCGRYGSWRYMSMEDALLDGERAASGLGPLI